MTLSQFAMGAVVLLPLLAAAVSVLLPDRGRRVLAAATAVTTALGSAVVVTTVASGRPVELALGAYEAPLGIMLRADGLSALFLSLAAVVGTIVTISTVALPEGTGVRLSTGENGSLRLQEGHPGFWPLWLGCWSGLNAVFLSGDLFNTYVGLEMVGLSAVGLVALGGRQAWTAALRYLFIAVPGSLMFLVAVALVVSATGTLDIEQAAGVLAENPQHHPVLVLALALLSLGLCLKLALVPMHQWLIPAHAGAPAEVSPLLSALVIKASLFVVLRCWIWLAGPALSPVVGAAENDSGAAAATTVLAWTLAVLGVLSLLLGSVMALRQTHLKPLIAYSTVAQVGYWFLMLPMLVDPESDTLRALGVTDLDEDSVIAGAVTGTVALALGHGLSKAGLFLAAGYLKEQYGTDELSELRGAGPRHPMLVLGMGCCAISLAGLPISLGFTGKWDVALAGTGSANYWVLPVLVAGTLLTVAYLLRPMSVLLVASEDDDSTVPAPGQRMARVPLLPQLAPFLLGVLTVGAGFLGAWLETVLEVGAPW